MAGVAAGLACSTAWSKARAGLEFEDLELERQPGMPRRVRLLFDPGKAPKTALLLLHGKGEAGSEAQGLRAWSHLYGLMDAYERLRTPPVQPILEQPRVEPERLRRINTALASNPFEGLALICPPTPDPANTKSRSRFFDGYTDWLLETVAPAARKRLPSLGEQLGLDGCSMGGYVALEVFLRHTEAFASFGTVQGAIGEWRVEGYVKRFQQQFARLGPRPVHIQTSTYDPFRRANETLSKKLTQAGVANDLEVIPGSHNQPWLRQLGTLEMLRWHESRL
jgi:pimeloyl-ACP methyl ester carboxylesterase